LHKNITATVEVKNTGKRAGVETILWFIRDDVGKITRPVRLLKHFEKVELPAGINKKVSFTIIPQQHLAYPDATNQQLIENGSFTLLVGDKIRKFWYTGNH
jgi:beta-glucosidase